MAMTQQTPPAKDTAPHPFLRFIAGVLTHWQVLASGVLLTGGVWGLSFTYESYCGVTDLAYAPVEVHGAIEGASAESGYRPGIIASQLETESHWRSGVSSPAGARGLAQFTTDTWDIWGAGGDISDPQDSIGAQGRYLAYLKERLAPLAEGDDHLLRLVLAGYNAGPGAVEEYRGVPPYPETENYVERILDLSETKYKTTCTPEPGYSRARLVTG